LARPKRWTKSTGCGDLNRNSFILFTGTPSAWMVLIESQTVLGARQMTTLYMPHFVAGGGYTTQFILFSGSANQSSNGTLQFFSQTGQLLGLSLR
jgi:hypothetical protein